MKLKAETVNEVEVDRLLTEALAALRQVSGAVRDLNRRLELIQQRIESGEVRQQAEAEMRQWLAENPEAVLQFRKSVVPPFD